MAINLGAEPGDRALFWVSHMGVEPSSTAFLDQKQTAGLEAEQPGH